MDRLAYLLFAVQLLHETLHVRAELLVAFVFKQTVWLVFGWVVHLHLYGLEVLLQVDFDRHNVADLQLREMLVERMSALVVEHDRLDWQFDDVLNMLRVVVALPLLLNWVWSS